MARTAKSFEDRIASVVNDEPSEAQKDFAEWLENVTGVEVDVETLKMRDRLYNVYLSTDEAKERAEARKAANAEANAAKMESRKQKLLAQAAKLGLTVIEAE